MALFRQRFLLLFLIPMVMLASCAGKPEGNGGTITEMKYYHLDSTTPPRTRDPMILAEPKRLLYGAVQPEEMAARFGHYYTVFWKVNDVTRPVVIELEYKQIKKPTVVQRLVVSQTEPAPKNKTDFRIIGEPYLSKGRIYAWRATISQGGTLMDTYESYLWSRSSTSLSSEIIAKSSSEPTALPLETEPIYQAPQ
jgi:hypothetical protein